LHWRQPKTPSEGAREQANLVEVRITPRRKLALALGSGAALLLASIRGLAQSLLSPDLLRTPFDEINLTELIGVPQNELDLVPFHGITFASGNIFGLLDGETLAFEGAAAGAQPS
jgi:hypothetical protein